MRWRRPIDQPATRCGPTSQAAKPSPLTLPAPSAGSRIASALSPEGARERQFRGCEGRYFHPSFHPLHIPRRRLHSRPSPPIGAVSFRRFYRHPLEPGVSFAHCAAHKSALENDRVAGQDRVVGGSLPIRRTSPVAVGEQSCLQGPERRRGHPWPGRRGTEDGGSSRGPAGSARRGQVDRRRR